MSHLVVSSYWLHNPNQNPTQYEYILICNISCCAITNNQTIKQTEKEPLPFPLPEGCSFVQLDLSCPQSVHSLHQRLLSTGAIGNGKSIDSLIFGARMSLVFGGEVRERSLEGYNSILLVSFWMLRVHYKSPIFFYHTLQYQQHRI